MDNNALVGASFVRPTWKPPTTFQQESPEPPVIERRRTFTPSTVEQRETIAPLLPLASATQRAPHFLDVIMWSEDEIATAERQMNKRKRAEESPYLKSPPQVHSSRGMCRNGTLSEESIPDTERTLNVSRNQHHTPVPLLYPQGMHSFVRSFNSEEPSASHAYQHDVYPVAGLSHTKPTSAANNTIDDQYPPRKKICRTHSAEVYENATPVPIAEQSFEDNIAMEAAAAVVERTEGPATRGGLRRSGRHMRVSHSGLSASPAISIPGSVASTPKIKTPRVVRKIPKAREGGRAGSSVTNLSWSQETQRFQSQTRDVAFKSQATEAHCAPQKTSSPPVPLRYVTRHNHTPSLRNRYLDLLSRDNDDEDDEDTEGDSPIASHPEVNDPPIPLALPHHQRRTSPTHGHGAGYGRLTGHVTDGDAVNTLYAASLVMRMGEKQRPRSSYSPKLAGGNLTIPAVRVPGPIRRFGFDGAEMMSARQAPSQSVSGDRVFGGVVAGASEMHDGSAISIRS